MTRTSCLFYDDSGCLSGWQQRCLAFFISLNVTHRSPNGSPLRMWMNRVKSGPEPWFFFPMPMPQVFDMYSRPYLLVSYKEFTLRLLSLPVSFAGELKSRSVGCCVFRPHSASFLLETTPSNVVIPEPQTPGPAPWRGSFCTLTLTLVLGPTLSGKPTKYLYITNHWAQHRRNSGARPL